MFNMLAKANGLAWTFRHVDDITIEQPDRAVDGTCPIRTVSMMTSAASAIGCTVKSADAGAGSA
jgi:hypothetical protein